MFGIGTPEMIVIGIIAVVALRRRVPSTLNQFQTTLESVARQLRDTTMTERLKKFLWTPQFWAVLGIVGCATGWYFQGVAANGAGLWCLGLMFLGAAYLEQTE